MKLNGITIVLIIVAITISFTRGLSQITFVIEELPQATPREDTIFIAGTFNNWSVHDPAYMLKKRLDGKYSITLPDSKNTVEYKFTRGSWAKVETNGANEYMPNRKFNAGNGKIVLITIANWQDVGGVKPWDIIIFYFFAIALIGGVVSAMLLRSKNRRKQESKQLAIFLLFISSALLGRVGYEMVSIKAKFICEVLGGILFFIGGPLWYFLVSAKKNAWTNILLRHGMPIGVITTIAVLKLLNVSALSFLATEAVDEVITWDSLLILGSGLISSAVYFIAGLRALSVRRIEQPMEYRFYRHLQWMGGIVILCLLVNFSMLPFVKDSFFTWLNTNLIFIGVTPLILGTAHYIFRHSDIFKVVPQSLRKDEVENVKTLLHTAMKDQKLFRNPDLTLNDLSDHLQLKPHQLSRMINEGYQQNFRDFVNRYRVEEFIELVKQEDNRRFTFLALANTVGFKSKSTFNAAFKKVMQKPPREFFKLTPLLHEKSEKESMIL